MKKYLFSLFLCCVSPFCFAFSQIELVTLLNQPQNTQGNFQQQRFLKSLTKPITTTGQFTLVKGQGLLWQMQKPFENTLRVKEDGISQWNGTEWVNNNKIGQSQQISLFLGLLTGNTAELAKQFHLQLQGDAQHWQLTLVPTSLLMKQIFTQIKIQGDQIVKMIEINEVQGDNTQIRFEQVKLNQPLSDFARSALAK